VRGTDSRSFKLAYPDVVADTVQCLTNLVPGNGEDSRHVFKNQKIRHKLSGNPVNLSPQITRVFFSSAPSSHRDGLAGGASVDDVDTRFNVSALQFLYILINRHVRPVFAQYAPAKGVLLAHGGRAYPSGFGGKVEAADP
jgi:hypothetical protein